MTVRKYFGTDGVRGRVGNSCITPDFVLKLGWAVGKVLVNGERKKVLIGKDTRISGYMLESALEAGLSSAGVDVHLLGPMPTPAIAYLTQTLRASAGIVISASHNLFDDNGIKFFSSEGLKLDDTIEQQIEAQLERPFEIVASKDLGKAYRIDDAPGRYIEFCKSAIKRTTRLSGLKIIVDCANGATYHIAPNVFRELGAEVIEVATEPDGFNINAHCGSTDPKNLQKMVVAQGADLGIALDGDGDRVLLIDHKGEIIDGDEMLYIIAKDRLKDQRLNGGVVGTLMSNLGLEQAMQTLGIEFVRAQVGDRYVMEQMRAKGWNLGGESSGHIICMDKISTGDGIIAALQILSAMHNVDQSLHRLKQGMQKFPQINLSVKTPDAQAVVEHATVINAVSRVTSELNHLGRVVLRPSGTEPVTRVMVEGKEVGQVTAYANELAQIVADTASSIPSSP